MPVRAVFFDVGETIVNEERYWRQVAALAGVEVHALWAALGITIARGEEHTAVYGHLGIERPAAADDVVYGRADLYPDALECLRACLAEGLVVGLAGNQSAALEAWARDERLPVDVIGSSARWGVRKPSPAFFARMVDEAGCRAGEVAYVGDRVDNDVLPALAAGLVAIHVSRGPWGRIQRGGEHAHAQVRSLLEVPAALARL